MSRKIKEIKDSGIKPFKGLGQNFFITEKYIELLIESGDFKKNELVIEIGPGTGFITEKLIKRDVRIIAIEKDRNLIKFLEKKFGKNKKIEILNQDFLNVNLKKLTKNKPYKIISNIPHNITGKIIRKILELKNKPGLVVFSLQKEVAEKITKRGRVEKENLLSIIFQIYGDVKFIEKIPAGAFWPKPKTDSGIIKISFPKNSKVGKQSQFVKFVKNGFSSPRKKVITNLSKGLKINKDILIKIFSRLSRTPPACHCKQGVAGRHLSKKCVAGEMLGFSINARPENLSFNDWKTLFQKINK